MAIVERTPAQRAALYFKSAGLGDRSAVEAARLLTSTSVSFETAAVLGQRMDEASTATPAKIRDAADRYSRTTSESRTTNAWGRALREDAPPTQTPTALLVEAHSARVEHPERPKVIDGVLHHEVTEYRDVVGDDADEAQEAAPRRSAWGRELEA